VVVGEAATVVQSCQRSPISAPGLLPGANHSRHVEIGEMQLDVPNLTDAKTVLNLTGG